MSLYGSMRTAISGMGAQSDRLGTVADNIANSGTTGYKRASVEFSSLVIPNSGEGHTPGGVVSNVRHAISEQGTLNYTTSTTDLAIEGSGFFVVSDAKGGTSLTRAGAFVPDASGNLVNAAGYQLMGYAYSEDGPQIVANGFNGLEPVNLNQAGLDVTPSTEGTLAVNLPSEAEQVGPVILNQPPSENSPFVAYNRKLSAVTSSASGDLVYTDVYFTKLDENTWEITAFDNYSGTPSGTPYDLESGDIKMGTTTVEFDPATGEIINGDPVIVTDPADPVYLDFSELTQTLGGGGASSAMQVDMNLPSDDPILDTAAGEQPASSNDPAAVFNSTLKMNGYLGGNVDLDFYFTRTGTDTWEVAVYDASTATAGGFPYGEPALEVGTLTFDTATGDLTGGGALSVPLPSGDSLPVDLSGTHSIPDFTAGPDEGAQFSFDLPASDPTVEPYLAGTTPAANQPSSTYSHKTSLVAYDNVGNEVLLDVYYAKGPDNSWEISVFDQADATDGGFPYGAAGSQPLASELLEFDPNGQIVGDARLTLQVPVGKELTLDLSESTQLSADFTVQEADVNGDGASKATGYSISAEGIVYAEFENGSYRPLYQIALADVPSPDFLEPASGNVFQQTAQSGDARLGVAGSSGFGTVRSGALENSTVDIAKELTTMIEAQRTYTANSKSFQTSSELLEVLVNLKR